MVEARVAQLRMATAGGQRELDPLMPHSASMARSWVRIPALASTMSVAKSASIPSLLKWLESAVKAQDRRKT